MACPVVGVRTSRRLHIMTLSASAQVLLGGPCPGPDARVAQTCLDAKCAIRLRGGMHSERRRLSGWNRFHWLCRRIAFRGSQMLQWLFLCVRTQFCPGSSPMTMRPGRGCTNLLRPQVCNPLCSGMGRGGASRWRPGGCDRGVPWGVLQVNLEIPVWGHGFSSVRI